MVCVRGLASVKTVSVFFLSVALASAALGAVRADMLDTRNYIVNTRMVGPVAAGELPRGWTTHHLPDTETVAKVTWVKDDPRPGYHSIRLQWISGGSYIAVQPALVKRVVGEVPMTLEAYPRTAAGGRAQFIVHCLDGAGRIIQQHKSGYIENAKDYETLTLNFVTRPDTRDLRVFCANVGKGSVWFHWVKLEPNMQLAAKMPGFFPYTVSCEPAEGNRFWNDGKAIIRSFRDSPVSVSFAFWGDKSRLDNPRLIVEVPEGLVIPEAFNMQVAKPVAHARAEFTTLSSPERRHYVRYLFPGPAALKRLPLEPNLNHSLVMCFIPERYESGKEYVIYYHAENGELKGREKQFTLRILPPMRKTPNPKRFRSYLWTVNDINFYDMNLVERVVRKYEEAALAGRRRMTGGREEIERVDRFLTQRGWFMFAKMGDWGFSRSESRAIGVDGKPAPYGTRHGYCPTHVVTDKGFFQEHVVSTARDHLTISAEGGRVKLEDGEYVFLDFEPWSVPGKYCFCERCRKRFSRMFNIPLNKIQTGQDILTNYSKEWGRFWVWLCDEIIRRHTEAVKQVNPTFKNFLYCYALHFENPEAAEKYLFSIPLDTRMNQKHMDVLGLSFYHIRGKRAFDLIDINARALETPVYTMPLMGGSGPFITAWGSFIEDEILSPAAMRGHILTVAASGAAGVIPYQGRYMDGMYFLKIDQALGEVAVVEDFYMDGKRRDETVSFEGLVQYWMNYHVDDGGGPPDAFIRSGWPDYIGIRAHELNGNLLLTVFNFHRQKSASLGLKIRGSEKVEWTVVDGITHKSTKRATPSADDMRGPDVVLDCFVPAEDVIFILLTPK